MAEVVLFGIAEEILKNLGSRALDEIVSAHGFKAQFENLKNTITSIKDVLLDAEEKQADDHAVRDWLERLATAVYAADDLVDEVSTIATRQQLMDRNTLSEKVQTFFFWPNQSVFAKVSRKMKTIREELDVIVKDGTWFDFARRPHEVGSRMSSSREAEVVIGRDGDKKAVLEMLLASSSTDEKHENEMLPVIPIVGNGGMGKTTLAQFICNDPQVKEHFELRLWLCVSNVLDIKVIIRKILLLVTNMETHKLEIVQLQGLLRKVVGDKKYLIVLDDVCNEHCEEWSKLKALLKIGRRGSKILVTTRSREVAEMMGTLRAYVLQGLSEERSWDLFEKTAFKLGQAQPKPHLVEVGKEIVKKCANVPLSIRTTGSMLYGMEDSKWLSIKDIFVAKISANQSDIMKVLKLSYHHLLSPLKNCFSYCALFQKGYEFDKEVLMDLWIAEGFVTISAANEGQSLDEIAEEYFLTLLQRGFFQEIRMNEWGVITSCKMHDLMHDLAQEVSGVKCKVADFAERNFDDKTLHLSFAYQLTSSSKIPNEIQNLKQLRTFLLPEQRYVVESLPLSKSIYQSLITRSICLRVLDLHNLSIKSLPSSIGKLIHLRYLNLSCTLIEELPSSITDLLNLQTLKLRLTQLRTLPPNIRKLTNLRSLDVSSCSKLIHMPSGIGGLTLLSKLPKFIVNHSPELSSMAKLSDLKNLDNLRGHLEIVIHGETSILEATEAELTSKDQLTELLINFNREMFYLFYGCNHDLATLEGLKPHSNLKMLKILNYRGQMLPNWARMDNLSTTLPNLVELKLENCRKCIQIPVFSQLRFLKRLKVSEMDTVEYMENAVCDDSSSSSSSKLQRGKTSLFFPSLEELEMKDMKNLKGWWKGYEDHLLSSMHFSNMSKLSVVGCRNLISLPLCPKMEILTLTGTNDSLLLSKLVTTSESVKGVGLKLKQLKMDHLDNQLILLPKQCINQLSSLTVHGDNKLVSTKILGEVFSTTTLSSSLQTLVFYNCKKLRSISKGLENLTALKELVFDGCEMLKLSPIEDEDANDSIPWKALRNILCYLTLSNIRELNYLPTGFRYLTNLRSLKLSSLIRLKELPKHISYMHSLEHLDLYGCLSLTSLPEDFSKLTSLKYFRIKFCPALAKQCRGPDGGEWPNIQHVPLVIVSFKVHEIYFLLPISCLPLEKPREKIRKQMAEAALFGIAEEILKNVGSTAIDEIASAWGFKSQLEKLKNTVNTLKDVLLDAEDRQADSHAVRGWVARLTTAVYAADDLFDEFSTVASRKQLMGGNKLTKEVQTFFSCSNEISLALKISQKIKRIRQELDDVVKDSTQFAFVLRPHHEGRVIYTGRSRRDETYSFVDSEEVIGRDDDKKAVLDLLLAYYSIDNKHEDEDEVLPVISIVGIGGLGKTTLAQLIYNDPQVKDHFELMLWVCVSDVFDIKDITLKIIMSATNTESQKLEMEQLQGRLRNEIGDKKYLLVLDDVWNENRGEWLKLRGLLKIGRQGSKILVTTRSREVAEIMGNCPPHELQGLSEEKSWELFEKMAFKLGQAQQKPHLVQLGKEIVKKCANVPLAIRALGSLLYGKDETKWISIKDASLAKISDNQNNVLNILKLSYQHLCFPLKNCFGYCSLFPKDYLFDKETLIDLWMAEGFIANESQRLEEVANEYFLTLLQRCFFQDIKRDEWGAIKSCKMHDLMHDLAQQVAGVKCKVANFSETKFDGRIHHLSFAYRLTSSWKIPNSMLSMKLLRTFLLPEQMKDGSTFSKSICQQLMLRFSCLRVLDLHDLGVKSLPSSIGKLIHLRFLNLCKMPIVELPDSITQLHNLQTLKLYHCSRLKTLPKHIKKLTNLRSLDIDRCSKLSHLPSGIGELTLLHKLPLFIVDHNLRSKSRFKPKTAKLSDLQKLNNLRGVLCIEFNGDKNYGVRSNRGKLGWQTWND
ncbi:putative disease resistance protein RGA4 [Spinacia oleracea]|uniref:Disease resistance protein RGA4 n=1 Tax=Spinacia oleracea TaxID=3562 RepID=A0ABM3QZS8_SPIOL|nr:putative disease resistance protein RGA4 [Spinacia oleracea]